MPSIVFSFRGMPLGRSRSPPPPPPPPRFQRSTLLNASTPPFRPVQQREDSQRHAALDKKGQQHAAVDARLKQQQEDARKKYEGATTTMRREKILRRQDNEERLLHREAQEQSKILLARQREVARRKRLENFRQDCLDHTEEVKTATQAMRVEHEQAAASAEDGLHADVRRLFCFFSSATRWSVLLLVQCTLGSHQLRALIALFLSPSGGAGRPHAQDGQHFATRRQHERAARTRDGLDGEATPQARGPAAPARVSQGTLFYPVLFACRPATLLTQVIIDRAGARKFAQRSRSLRKRAALLRSATGASDRRRRGPAEISKPAHSSRRNA